MEKNRTKINDNGGELRWYKDVSVNTVMNVFYTQKNLTVDKWVCENDCVSKSQRVFGCQEGLCMRVCVDVVSVHQ